MMTLPNLPIVSPIDIADQLESLYDRGLPPGDDIGWRPLSKLYTVEVGQMTLVHGMPGSGKSEFVDAIMVNLAASWGWKFALYSPENWPVEIHVAKLCEKFISKPFSIGPTERMTKDEMHEAMHWVLDRFLWLDPHHKTYRGLLDAALKFRRAAKKFGVVLDPWNALESARGEGQSDTDYIGRSLSEMRLWVRDNSAHLWVVAHPKKIEVDQGTGKRRVPTPYDVNGSAHWFNAMDNIICVHRPDHNNDSAEIHIQKVRFKNIGRVGAVELCYNRVTGRYMDKKEETIGW